MKLNNKIKYYLNKIPYITIIIIIFVGFTYFLCMFITDFWVKKQSMLDFDPNQYAYHYELDGSPVKSPNNDKILRMKVVYNYKYGGSAYVYGSVACGKKNEKIIFLKKYAISIDIQTGKLRFDFEKTPTFNWKSNDIVIINEQEININNVASFTDV